MTPIVGAGQPQPRAGDVAPRNVPKSIKSADFQNQTATKRLTDSHKQLSINEYLQAIGHSRGCRTARVRQGLKTTIENFI